MKTKSFKPKIESVYLIQAFINENLVFITDDKAKRFKIDLVIEEIVVNIVNYGLREIEDGIINITVDQSENCILLRISDNGIAFNPLAAKDPDVSASIENRTPGGLGIYLVKQITNETKYVRGDGENCLSLFLNFTA